MLKPDLRDAVQSENRSGSDVQEEMVYRGVEYRSSMRSSLREGSRCDGFYTDFKESTVLVSESDQDELDFISVTERNACTERVHDNNASFSVEFILKLNKNTLKSCKKIQRAILLKPHSRTAHRSRCVDGSIELNRIQLPRPHPLRVRTESGPRPVRAWLS